MMGWMMAKDYYTGSFLGLKEFWEEKGRTKSFEKEYSIRLEGIKQIIEKIRRYLRQGLVLDIGCGPGIAASLFPESSRVIGLDFSISMLKNAKERISDVAEGSALSLPFRDCSFKVAACLFVASDYSDKAGIFSEAHRVLQEKGFLLFADYSLNDEHWKLKRVIRPMIGETSGIFLEDDMCLSNRIRKAGFRIRETKRLQFSISFKPERYVRSTDEINRIRSNNPDLWNDLQKCSENKKIDREFILIIGVK